MIRISRQSEEGEIVITDFEAIPITEPPTMAVKGGIMAITQFTARRDVLNSSARLANVTEP